MVMTVISNSFHWCPCLLRFQMNTTVITHFKVCSSCNEKVYWVWLGWG